VYKRLQTGGSQQGGIEVDKVSGPFGGYYVALRVSELDGKFCAAYKVCAAPPPDYASASPVRRKRVEGLLDTRDEAFDIAEQLARLQIAGLSPAPQAGDSSFRARAAELERLLEPYEPALDAMYSPTEPCPLYPAA
jgi:hypothetical protein